MVYFIVDAEKRYCKIGFSDDIHKRLSCLQVGNASVLELIGAIKGTREVERKLHKRFRNIKTTGEWFLYTEELAKYVAYITGNLVVKPAQTLQIVYTEEVLGTEKANYLLACLEAVIKKYEPIPFRSLGKLSKLALSIGTSATILQEMLFYAVDNRKAYVSTNGRIIIGNFDDRLLHKSLQDKL